MANSRGSAPWKLKIDCFSSPTAKIVAQSRIALRRRRIPPSACARSPIARGWYPGLRRSGHGRCRRPACREPRKRRRAAPRGPVCSRSDRHNPARRGAAWRRYSRGAPPGSRSAPLRPALRRERRAAFPRRRRNGFADRSAIRTDRGGRLALFFERQAFARFALPCQQHLPQQNKAAGRHVAGHDFGHRRGCPAKPPLPFSCAISARAILCRNSRRCCHGYRLRPRHGPGAPPPRSPGHPGR